MLESFHQAANALRRRPIHAPYERIKSVEGAGNEPAGKVTEGTRAGEATVDSVFLSPAESKAASKEPRSLEEMNLVPIASATAISKTRSLISKRELYLEVLLGRLGADNIRADETLGNAQGVLRGDIQPYGILATRTRVGKKSGIVFQLSQLPDTPESLRTFEAWSYSLAKRKLRAAICMICDEKPIFKSHQDDTVVAKHYDIALNFDPRLLEAQQRGEAEDARKTAFRAAREQQNLDPQQRDQPTSS